ncbi:MAG TPA: molybdopterin-dependent oxidoreductase [Candidatus Acidoferrum sp.]|jgi:anaerobic selenocysteine-containing dehydrogenase|nr:molybdopterin-dependent oxidoreductase [Candidatus Acidoferrum sp.]
MQRRDFFKITAATGALTVLESCGNPDHQLIRFIPDEDLTPGEATWKPSICTMCGAGCGTLVRVMQAEAEVVRNGLLGTIKMGAAKKIEGNPAHPVNKGRLCPRGQAALQVTYHPDRIKGPMALNGARGSGLYQSISWDEALKRLMAQLNAVRENKSGLAVLTVPLHGQRREVVYRFTKAFGQDVPVVEFEFLDRRSAYYANMQSFGYHSPVVVDFSQSNYVLSFGADFLGTWNSPVAQSVGYGEMRKGRPGQRGKLVQFEARVSQTGANADELVACPPGMEGAMALCLAHVILRDKLRPMSAGGAATSSIPGWTTGLTDFAPEKTAALAHVDAAKLVRIAHEAAASGPAVAIIGDIATAQTNGLFNAMAVNALNELLGSVGKPGGIQFSAPFAVGDHLGSLSIASQIASLDRSTKVLLLNGANPVFATPTAQGVRETLEKIPFIASFGSFLDETSILADLVLPDNSPLESWLDDTPESGTTHLVASVAAPVMSTLHNTKPMPDVLLSVAQQLGGDVAKALPWKTYDEAVKASLAQYQKQTGGSVTGKDADDFWTKVQAAGGWWSGESAGMPIHASGKANPAKNVAPQFDGDASQYPFYFLPFASQMFYDGSLAHLPWMQEAPDPLSSAMWSTWVEIHPQTAQKLGIAQADLLEVTSQHGTLQAPAMISPGIAPDAIAMPLGQGHEQYTRYASGRGANPISILAPLTTENGALAWGATRVKISKAGKGKLILFGGSLREADIQNEPR